MKPESTWTAPTKECPHPEYYHSEDEQATEHEVLALISGLVRAVQPEIVLETGTHIGIGAEYIGKALEANGHGWLHTFETDLHRWRAATERTAGLPVTCHNAHSTSNQWVPPAAIEFAWFDSDFPWRVSEFHHYKKWFNHRTVIGFHDTAAHHGSWSQSVRNLHDFQSFDLPTPRGVTIGRYLG